MKSDINITLIPLSTQRKLNSFRSMIEALEHANGTPEARFLHRLLSLMQRLKQKHEAYHHMVINTILLKWFLSLSFTSFLYHVRKYIIFSFLYQCFKNYMYCQDMFLGEILGAFFLVEGSNLSHEVLMESIKVLSNNNISEDGQVIIENGHEKLVKIITDIKKEAFYTNFANLLNSKRQSAVIASFNEQRKLWSNMSDDR